MQEKRGALITENIIRLIIVTVVIICVILFARKAYYYGYHIYNQTPMASGGTGTDVDVTIAEGSSMSDIAKTLKEAGLIEDPALFRLQERLSGHHGKIQPGTYRLNTSMIPDEMIAIMSAGYVDGEDGNVEGNGSGAGMENVTQTVDPADAEVQDGNYTEDASNAESGDAASEGASTGSMTGESSE